MIDVNKSIGEIENLNLSNIEPVSIIEMEMKKSLSIPIKNLKIENIRQLVRFGLYPDIVVPQAISIIKTNPYAEGEYFKGDLLIALAGIENGYLDRHETYVSEIQTAINKSLSKINSLNYNDSKTFMEALLETIGDNVKIYGKSHFYVKNVE